MNVVKILSMLQYVESVSQEKQWKTKKESKNLSYKFKPLRKSDQVSKAEDSV